MKWKKALSAEEAALFAMELEGYKSLNAVREVVNRDGNALAEAYEEGLPFVIEAIEAAEADHEILRELFDEAMAIYDALIDEIPRADGYFVWPARTSDLEILNRANVSEFDMNIVPEKCSLSKQSLARWFYEHDKSIAIRFDPHVEQNILEISREKKVKQVSNEPSTKTINTYLKTIAALSDALIGGLTDKKNKDADAVLAALDLKGVIGPVGSKTLAKYLEEAKEL